MKRNERFYVYRNPDLDCYGHPVVLTTRHPVKEPKITDLAGHSTRKEDHIASISVRDAKMLLGVTPISGRVYCIKMNVTVEPMPRRYLYAQIINERGEVIS